MAKVVLENLVKRFGRVAAVGGLDLEIEDGELTVLVGPSGCGKTTTLRMIAGLEEVTSGRILFDGEPVEHLPPKHRDIAMVFQSYALYPHMTVRQNMAFGLRMKRVAADEQTRLVRRAADLLNITELLDRKPKELSGGQRQRVAMGRALVRNPRVFLFDEPLSNLDAALRAQMRIEIKRIHQRLHTTIVYVTHDQIEAMTLADRIVVMNEGRIEQVGEPTSVYEAPANRFVAGFIGSPRMNFFPAKMVRDGTGMFVEIKGTTRLKLSADRHDAYSPFVGKEIEIGLRPEHLTDGLNSGDSSGQTMEVTVDVVEPTGSTNQIAFSLGGREFIALGDARLRRRSGDRVFLRAQIDRMHLIDPATGAVVPVPGERAAAVEETRIS